MHQISLREVNQHLSNYIDQVEKGDEIIITRRGKPVARLSPISKIKVLTSHQQAVWDKLSAHLRKGYHLEEDKFNRDEAHER